MAKNVKMVRRANTPLVKVIVRGKTHLFTRGEAKKAAKRYKKFKKKIRGRK